MAAISVGGPVFSAPCPLCLSAPFPLSLSGEGQMEAADGSCVSSKTSHRRGGHACDDERMVVCTTKGRVVCLLYPLPAARTHSQDGGGGKEDGEREGGVVGGRVVWSVEVGGAVFGAAVYCPRVVTCVPSTPCCPSRPPPLSPPLPSSLSAASNTEGEEGEGGGGEGGMGGYVIVGNARGQLKALCAETGQLIWTFTSQGEAPLMSSPLLFLLLPRAGSSAPGAWGRGGGGGGGVDPTPPHCTATAHHHYSTATARCSRSGEGVGLEVGNGSGGEVEGEREGGGGYQESGCFHTPPDVLGVGGREEGLCKGVRYRVVVGCQKGYVYCLDAACGSVCWQRLLVPDSQAPVSGSPCITSLTGHCIGFLSSCLPCISFLASAECHSQYRCSCVSLALHSVSVCLRVCACVFVGCVGVGV